MGVRIRRLVSNDSRIKGHQGDVFFRGRRSRPRPATSDCKDNAERSTLRYGDVQGGELEILLLGA
jgi:hypothetical protein